MAEVRFIYTNHKGETRERHVDVTALSFLTNPGWGYQPGWFLEGIDIEKGDHRIFSLDNITVEQELSFECHF